MAHNAQGDTNFIFEVGQLAKLPRSGFDYLRGEKQSIAEHIHRTVYIGLLLAAQEKDVDSNKVMRMCLFHDLAETRTGDLNHLNQQYVQADEKRAVKDATDNTSIHETISKDFLEYEERESREAILAKEADILELLATLQEIKVNGNPSVDSWISINEKRLKTEYGKELAETLKKVHPSDWWLGEKHQKWVDMNK